MILIYKEDIMLNMVKTISIVAIKFVVSFIGSVIIGRAMTKISITLWNYLESRFILSKKSKKHCVVVSRD
jgi:hypothetical protein